MANVGGSSVAVVGRRFDDYGNTADTVALIDHFLILFTVASGGFFDNAVNVVIGYVVGFRLCDKVAQSGVGVRVRAALTNGNRHFFTYLGKDAGACAVVFLLLVHDVLPFGMS